MSHLIWFDHYQSQLSLRCPTSRCGTKSSPMISSSKSVLSPPCIFLLNHFNWLLLEYFSTIIQVTSTCTFYRWQLCDTGDWLPRVSPGQLPQLGKEQLVPQLNQGSTWWLTCKIVKSKMAKSKGKGQKHSCDKNSTKKNGAMHQHTTLALAPPRSPGNWWWWFCALYMILREQLGKKRST